MARPQGRRAAHGARRPAPDARRLGRTPPRPRRPRLHRPARPQRARSARDQPRARARGRGGRARESATSSSSAPRARSLRRAPEAVNPNLPTGEVELQVDELEIVSRSEPLPFQLDEENVEETTRLRYRYLDLRRERMQRNLRLSATVVAAIRRYDGRAGLRRRLDAEPDEGHARGRARLPRAGAAAARAVLRARRSRRSSSSRS